MKVYNTWAGINNPVESIYGNVSFHCTHSIFILPNLGIWQNKIDLATGDPLTEAKLIFNGTLPLNASSRPEGPHIYFINDNYYLLMAEGGTSQGHRVTIQRGPSPSGPWENNPNNPVIWNGRNLSSPVQSTGHADIVEGDDGQWWGVCLATRPQGGNFSHQSLGEPSSSWFRNSVLINEQGEKLSSTL
jgi:beta-xylosidase